MFSGRASMEDLSLPDDLGEFLTQQLLKTTSPKGDGFDYDCEFDEEFDRLASQLCDGFGPLELCSSEQAAKRVEVGGDVKRFAEPKSDAEVDQLRSQGIPANTLNGTKWAVNVWRDWTAYRWSVCHPLDCPPHLHVCSNEELNSWLSKFVVKVRRKNGKPYPPQSLYQI